MGWTLEAPSDEALIAGIGERIQDALAEAYRRHGGAVWAVVRRVCGDGRAAVAEEVCGTVFADLWARPERFDPTRGSLRAWLVADGHTRAVEAVRAEPAPRSTPPSADVEVAGHATAPAGEARRAVEKLPPPERDALLLTYLGGHSCREAARRLGTSEDAVKRHVRLGLGKLRRAFQAQEVAP